MMPLDQQTDMLECFVVEAGEIGTKLNHTEDILLLRRDFINRKEYLSALGLRP